MSVLQFFKLGSLDERSMADEGRERVDDPGMVVWRRVEVPREHNVQAPTPRGSGGSGRPREAPGKDSGSPCWPFF